jgi:hypothetical protein
MVLTLEEVTPLKNHLRALMKATIPSANDKIGKYNQLCWGLAAVILSQSTKLPFNRHTVKAGYQDVTNRCVRSMSTLQAQLLHCSRYGLLHKVSTNHCNEYYINFELPEGCL